MKIIISPAKLMQIDNEVSHQKPLLLDKALELYKALQSKTYEELKSIWKTSDKLTQEYYEQLHHYDLKQAYSPAIYSFVGLQYQSMSVNTMSTSSLNYINDHLIILSGLYGALSPMDGIIPYRLEMNHKLDMTLYKYWDDTIYKSLNDHVIINLASKEYSKVIEKYITEDDTFITCLFGELKNGKLKQAGALSKKARGSMVRYMAENQILNPEELKSFHDGYKYNEELSDEKTYIFLKEV